jgi:type IX secretion system PorP/SprF family membrane protein
MLFQPGFKFFKSYCQSGVKILLTLLSVSFFYSSDAQQTPLNPLSYWVFTPYIYNPAMVGSKDYLTVDLNAAFQAKSYAQIVGCNTRLSKTQPGYFSSPQLKEFNGVGLGGSVFNDYNGSSHNIGLNAAGSYQFSMGSKNLSFLSFGASVKGVYNISDSSFSETGSPSKNTFYPNLDGGVYYYGTNLFTGVSVINVLGNPGEPDSLGHYRIEAGRQFYFSIGYKFLLSKTENIVLEPSILVNVTDSTFGKIEDNINPILKLYIDNICIGSYFFSNGNTSFFFQYRYPKFYLGAFYELPRKTAYYKKAPIVELTLGFNFRSDKSRFSKRSQW